MKDFIVYNWPGKILRTGICSGHDFFLQADIGEFVKEGIADDVTQKIENPGIAGVVVDKTPEEIKAEKPILPEIPFEKRMAGISNEQWQDVLSRLENLENKA